MADFIQNLDPSKLILVETVLTFATSGFSAPPYNLPLFLFGMYAQENAEATQSLRLFTGLLGGSAVLDIIWLSTHDQNWFIKTVSVIVLLLKAPAFFAFASALRQRGDHFTGLGGIRGGDLSGPTVWSMPGGFSSLGSSGRDGYQEVGGDDGPKPNTLGQTPAAQLSTTQSAASGPYQTV